MNIIRRKKKNENYVENTKYYDKYYILNISYIFACYELSKRFAPLNIS